MVDKHFLAKTGGVLAGASIYNMNLPMDYRLIATIISSHAANIIFAEDEFYHEFRDSYQLASLSVAATSVVPNVACGNFSVFDRDSMKKFLIGTVLTSFALPFASDEIRHYLHPKNYGDDSCNIEVIGHLHEQIDL